MGALFIGVVLLFPQGLAGIYEDYVRPQVAKLFSRKSNAESQGDKAVAQEAR